MHHFKTTNLKQDSIHIILIIAITITGCDRINKTQSSKHISIDTTISLRIDNEVLQIISREKARIDKPMTILNSKWFEEDLRIINKENIVFAKFFSGDEAIEIIGKPEAYLKGLMVIVLNITY